MTFHNAMHPNMAGMVKTVSLQPEVSRLLARFMKPTSCIPVVIISPHMYNILWILQVALKFKILRMYPSPEAAVGGVRSPSDCAPPSWHWGLTVWSGRTWRSRDSEQPSPPSPDEPMSPHTDYHSQCTLLMPAHKIWLCIMPRPIILLYMYIHTLQCVLSCIWLAIGIP